MSLIWVVGVCLGFRVEGFRISGFAVSEMFSGFGQSFGVSGFRAISAWSSLHTGCLRTLSPRLLNPKP